MESIKLLLSHFIPKGAPLAILILLFFIEIISLLIQPITLSIRLIANILTGHILLTLVLERKFFSLILFPLGLILLELIVRIIQAIVYVLLLMFYRT